MDAILAKALELSGRRGEHFVEYAPFAGLSGDQPVRAFAALRFEAKRGQYPEWAWRAFLNPDRRKDDPERLTAYVAERIARCTPEAIAGILRPVCDWIQKSAKVLAARQPPLSHRREAGRGTPASLIDVASRFGIDLSEASHILPLAFLAPQIIDSIVAGEQPAELTTQRLSRISDLPVGWNHQIEALDF